MSTLSPDDDLQAIFSETERSGHFVGTGANLEIERGDASTRLTATQGNASWAAAVSHLVAVRSAADDPALLTPEVIASSERAAVAELARACVDDSPRARRSPRPGAPKRAAVA